MIGKKRASIAAGALVGLIAMIVGIASTPSAADNSCIVEYVVVDQWNDGFEGSIEITNGSEAVDGWTLQFDLPAGQTIAHGWIGEFSQSGSTVTVSSMPWNSDLGPGASVTPGFIGSGNGGGTPTSFTLNGVPCNSGNGSTTTPASTTSTTEATTSTSTSTPVPTTSTSTTTTTLPITGLLYVDPTSSPAVWVAANLGDPRAAAIDSAIASKPIARWFGDWNLDIEDDVRSYVDQARESGAIPMLVAYNIPDRDCGSHSSGGAADFTQYRIWVDGFADGLGNGPAFIVLEPDALALNECAGSERNDAINDAVVTIKQECSSCQVYLDAGHSSWVSAPDMADRLRAAGVLQADGLATNVSNYNTIAAEEAYGRAVLAELGDQPDLGQVIDVSRNGNGPAPGGEWCDPAGRAVGVDPTTDTGIAHVDALLWVKVPGEADGCIAAAGQFVPDRAYELATN
jgi:endoglucanase